MPLAIIGVTVPVALLPGIDEPPEIAASKADVPAEEALAASLCSPNEIWP